MQHRGSARNHIALGMRASVLAIVAALLVPLCLAATAEIALADSAEPTSVVVIDAGHQARGDSRREPIGPGSRKTKPRVSWGTSGVVSRKAESAIDLKVALKLRSELQKRGVTVVMVRTSQRVNLSNSRRAKIANAAQADLTVRIHCDSAGRSTRGLLTIVPAKNRWTTPIVSSSASAGKLIHASTLAATGARSRGVARRGDMTGFNWSKVPSVIVEMGNMRNRTDDRLLNSAVYQDKLVTGIADGTMGYLATR